MNNTDIAYQLLKDDETIASGNFKSGSTLSIPYEMPPLRGHRIRAMKPD